MSTKRHISNFAELIGRFVAMVYPQAIPAFFRSFRNRLYTGYIRSRFAHLGNSVFIWRPLTLMGEQYICIGDNNIFEGDIQLSARKLTEKSPKLVIGNNCLIRHGSHITAVNCIVIGNDLLTGTNVIITDNAHGLTNDETLHTSPRIRSIVSKGSVTIGNNVWLGNNVCIMPNVSIGDGVVVGANSVVTHDIPSYTVAAGVPARIISRGRKEHDARS